ncbi:hypothetical protein [Micromonospora chalcea]|uniref:hypothetical protein n=1 Tax=Micromonospora chalcea TaxID=1874 RepID=UPI002378A739|nr:hypothetical protein [Micromonospora chalcea]WDQ00126.1 hypothetical protein PVK74_30630 [Micromonospora chalcea]
MQWLLQCNPIKWRIHDFVSNGHEVHAWTVTRHLGEIIPDDDVALWLTGSTGGAAEWFGVTSQRKSKWSRFAAPV